MSALVWHAHILRILVHKSFNFYLVLLTSRHSFPLTHGHFIMLQIDVAILHHTFLHLLSYDCFYEFFFFLKFLMIAHDILQ